MFAIAIIYSFLLLGISSNESILLQFLFMSVFMSFVTMNPLPIIVHISVLSVKYLMRN